MKEPFLITEAQIVNIVDRTISLTLTELGIKRRLITPYMSQNQAVKLVGETRLRRAMESGRVRWQKENPEKKLGRVFVNKKDILKLLNNPVK